MAKAKAKVDVPGWGGPVEVKPFEDMQAERTRAIAGRADRLSAIRRLPAEALVPEHVRQEYAVRWRDEHEELQREEMLTRAYRWRAIFRRLVDRIVGRPKLPDPIPPRYDFRG